MIELNDHYEEIVSFTQADIRIFADVSGDRNPIHIDEAYARSTFFGKPIVHGMLAASVFSKIFGTKFPGEGTVYLSQNLKFLAPVYPNEKYVASVEVIEVIREKHNAAFSTTLEDTEKKVCITGFAKIKHKFLI